MRRVVGGCASTTVCPLRWSGEKGTTTMPTLLSCSTRYQGGGSASVHSVMLSFVEECVRAEQWDAAQSSLTPVVDGLKLDPSGAVTTSTISSLSALLKATTAAAAAGDNTCSSSETPSTTRNEFLLQLEAAMELCNSPSSSSLPKGASKGSTGTGTREEDGGGVVLEGGVDRDRSLRLYENEDEDGSDPGRPRRHLKRHDDDDEDPTSHKRSPFTLDSTVGWKTQGRGWKNPSRTKPNRIKGPEEGGGVRLPPIRPRQTEAGGVLSETLHLNRQLTEILRNMQEIQSAQEMVDAKRHAEQGRRYPGQPNSRKFTKVSPVIQERMRSLVAGSWTRAFTLVSDTLCSSRVRQQISAASLQRNRVDGMPNPSRLLMHPIHTSTFSVLMGILSTFPGEAAAKTAAHESIADYYKSKFNSNNGASTRGVEEGVDSTVVDGSKGSPPPGIIHTTDPTATEQHHSLTSVPPPDPYDPASPTLTAERRCMLILGEYGKLLASQRADLEYVTQLRLAMREMKNNGDGSSMDQLKELLRRPPPLPPQHQHFVEEEGVVDGAHASSASTPSSSCSGSSSSSGSVVASVFPPIRTQLHQRSEDIIRELPSSLDEIIECIEEFGRSNSLEPSMSLMKASADASKKISSSKIATSLLFSSSFRPATIASTPTNMPTTSSSETTGDVVVSEPLHSVVTTTHTSSPPSSVALTPSSAIGAIVALTKRRQWELAVSFIEGMRRDKDSANPAIKATAVGVLTHLNLASHVAACMADGAVYCRRGAALYLFNRGQLEKYPNPEGTIHHDRTTSSGEERGVVLQQSATEKEVAVTPTTTTTPGLSIVAIDELQGQNRGDEDGYQHHQYNQPGTWRSNIVKELRKDPKALPSDYYDSSTFSHWEYALGVIGGASESVSPGLGVVYGLRALRTMGLWERAIWVLQEYRHHLTPEGLGNTRHSPLGSQQKIAASAVMLRENSRSWIPGQGIAAAEKLLRDSMR